MNVNDVGTPVIVASCTLPAVSEQRWMYYPQNATDGAEKIDYRLDFSNGQFVNDAGKPPHSMQVMYPRGASQAVFSRSGRPVPGDVRN